MNERIESYFLAGYPAIYVVSAEEQRVEAAVQAAAANLAKKVGHPVSYWAWSCVTGVVDLSAGEARGALTAEEAVTELSESTSPTILLLRDIHANLGDDADPMFIRLLRESFRNIKADKDTARMLILCGPVLNLPPELARELPVVDLPLPTKGELTEMVQEFCVYNELPIPDADQMDALVGAASGLTSLEATNALAISVVEAGTPDAAVLMREKAQTLRKGEVLEVIEPGRSLADIGGLGLLKAWVRRRRRAFGQAARDYGLPVPRGLLILGLPGCGKSLTARATASALEMPLLRLDMGRIFGSLVGQSEQRIREAIQVAEAVAPCCLWVDEIDKGVAGAEGGQTDGGTSSRVLGTLLTWMQEKTSPVFVIATANNPWMLPAPLVRKGRFDELFYVDLPTDEERADIWQIHLARYAKDTAINEKTIKLLSKQSGGFTGSEIEACVIEAMSTAFDEEVALGAEHLSASVSDCTPLSKTMSAELERIRSWVAGRARPASASQQSVPKKEGRRVIVGATNSLN